MSAKFKFLKRLVISDSILNKVINIAKQFGFSVTVC